MLRPQVMMVHISKLVRNKIRGANKNVWKWDKKKPSGIWTTHPEFAGTETYLLAYSISCIIHRPRLVLVRNYVHIYSTNRRLGLEQIFRQKNDRTAPVAGRRRAHGRGRPWQIRERRARWGMTANSTPNDGPHLELGRVLLKIWSKSDFSIARRTAQHICTCVYILVWIVIIISKPRVSRWNAKKERRPHITPTPTHASKIQYINTR